MNIFASAFGARDRKKGRKECERALKNQGFIARISFHFLGLVGLISLTC